MVLGPGLITGASDDDPSGIGTYAVAGARYGFATLWTMPVMLPMMAAIQFMSAKIGMVAGTGLAGALRLYYPRRILWASVMALVVANIINVGADIGAIAAAVNILVPVPVAVAIVPIGVGLVLLQVFGSYALISRVFRWLTVALLAYIATAFFSHPRFGDIARGTFVPHIHANTGYVAMLVALAGTTISPYLWFWQSSQEVDEEVARGKKTPVSRLGASDRELSSKAWDVNSGMVLSQVVAYFIILTTAATLWRAGQTNIQSASDAAEALRPLAGDAAKYLLAFGLVGAGLLAVPVLSGSAAYGMAEALDWHSSLDAKPSHAKGFYSVIAVATLVGMLINYAGINPIDALFYTAVLNGLVAPPLLILIMVASNNRKILGSRTNGRALNVIGWATTGVMTLAAVAFLATWAADTA